MPIDFNNPGVLIDFNGARLGFAREINFAGAGLSVTLVNGVATVTVPAGITSIQLDNTAFVAKNGVDLTGVVGRLDKPFLTITAAQTAVAAGQAIYVYPGVYTDNNLGKNGVDYFFQDGAMIVAGTGNIWLGGAAVSYSVSGNGEFIATSTVNGQGRTCNFVGACNVVFQAKRIENRNTSAFTNPCLFVETSAKVWMSLEKDILSTANEGVRVAGGGSTNAEELYLTCSNITGSTFGVIQQNSTSYIRCNYISGGATGFFCAGNGIAKVYADIRGGTNAAIRSGSNVGHVGVYSFYGDIDGAVSGVALALNTQASGVTINCYGKVSGTVDANETGGFSFTGNLFLYKGVTSLTPSKPSVRIAGGSTGTIYVYDRVVNLDTNVLSVPIKKDSGVVILNSVTLVSSGTAPCVDSDSGQFVLCYGASQANNAKGANPVLQVSAITIDPNVV